MWVAESGRLEKRNKEKTQRLMTLSFFCWKLAPLKMAQAEERTGWEKKSGRKCDSEAVTFSLIEAPAALAYASAAGGRAKGEGERV
jgi:hypothetical protein